MSSNQSQKPSMKDRITAHLPGHKNQDNNANGIPDRMERTNTTGAPLNTTHLATGSTFVPGTSTTTTTTSITKDVNGLPINGNILKDKTITSTTATTEPALITPLGAPMAAPMVAAPLVSQRSGSFTDLNRNGIPDQLEGQGFGFVGSVASIQTSVVDVREGPASVQRIEKPAVVHEILKTEEVVQIQPIINREREQLDVYEVVQPMREREVMATEVREAVLPTQTRATIVEDNSAFLAQRSMPSDVSTREVAATRSAVVENAPIVHETIIHKVIEEVQPVIYKEIDRSVLIKETLPIYEKVVEAPRVHHSVLPMSDMGVRNTTTFVQTGYTDLNRDGIPDQLQGGMYQTTGLQSGLQSQGVYGQQGFQQTGFAQQGLNQDLNRNGIPDQFERQGSYGLQQPLQPTVASTGLTGGLNDRNGNGIPDNLEHKHRTLSDLNGNGVPDRMEKGHGLKDLNGNGVDDSLERRMGSTTLNPNTTY